MPLMDYFTSGGDPMAAVMKQIQGAMESFGSRGGTPPQPTQAPVNPQNAWSLFSGSTNPYTSTGPSKEYQEQRAMERAAYPIVGGVTDVGGARTYDRNEARRGIHSFNVPSVVEDRYGERYVTEGKSLPPMPQEGHAPGSTAAGRRGIETWPEGKLDMKKIFNMKAPRWLRKEMEIELGNLPYYDTDRFTDISTPRPRYNPEMASPKKPYSIGDVIAKWLLETGGLNLKGKWEKDNYEPAGTQEGGPFREGFASALPDVPPQALKTYGGTWLEKYPDLIRSHRENVIRAQGGIKRSADVGEGKTRLDRVWPDDMVEMLWNYFYPRYLESGRYNK